MLNLYHHTEYHCTTLRQQQRRRTINSSEKITFHNLVWVHLSLEWPPFLMYLIEQ